MPTGSAIWSGSGCRASPRTSTAGTPCFPRSTPTSANATCRRRTRGFAGKERGAAPSGRCRQGGAVVAALYGGRRQRLRVGVRVRRQPLGRAVVRERVCQDGSFQVVVGSLNKQH